MPEFPRRFDMLVVDEVHTCAPVGDGPVRRGLAAHRGDPQLLAPHCEHRLFLSATPHNGYPNSFAALLELLDPHRFARRHQADRGAAQAGDGAPAEVGAAAPVERQAAVPEARAARAGDRPQPTRRREAYAKLTEYARSRRAGQADGKAGRTAADFVTTLLKKRLPVVAQGVRGDHSHAPGHDDGPAGRRGRGRPRRASACCDR